MLANNHIGPILASYVMLLWLSRQLEYRHLLCWSVNYSRLFPAFHPHVWIEYFIESPKIIRCALLLRVVLRKRRRTSTTSTRTSLRKNPTSRQSTSLSSLPSTRRSSSISPSPRLNCWRASGLFIDAASVELCMATSSWTAVKFPNHVRGSELVNSTQAKNSAAPLPFQEQCFWTTFDNDIVFLLGFVLTVKKIYLHLQFWSTLVFLVAGNILYKIFYYYLFSPKSIWFLLGEWLRFHSLQMKLHIFELESIVCVSFCGPLLFTKGGGKKKIGLWNDFPEVPRTVKLAV